jgi:hypothetical protein
MDSLRRRATFKFSEDGEEQERIFDEQGGHFFLQTQQHAFLNVVKEQDEVIQKLREQSQKSKEQQFIFVRILVLLSAMLWVIFSISGL